MSFELIALIPEHILTHYKPGVRAIITSTSGPDFSIELPARLIKGTWEKNDRQKVWPICHTSNQFQDMYGDKLNIPPPERERNGNPFIVESYLGFLANLLSYQVNDSPRKPSRKQFAKHHSRDRVVSMCTQAFQAQFQTAWECHKDRTFFIHVRE